MFVNQQQHWAQLSKLREQYPAVDAAYDRLVEALPEARGWNKRMAVRNRFVDDILDAYGGPKNEAMDMANAAMKYAVADRPRGA